MQLVTRQRSHTIKYDTRIFKFYIKFLKEPNEDDTSIFLSADMYSECDN